MLRTNALTTDEVRAIGLVELVATVSQALAEDAEELDDDSGVEAAAVARLSAERSALLAVALRLRDMGY